MFLYNSNVEVSMFEVNNGITNINGKQGKYDNKVTDPSVKYGRNAVEN